MEIAIILAVLTLTGAGATFFKIKKKKNKEKNQNNQNNQIPPLTVKEKSIIALINDMMKAENPPQTYVIRDRNEIHPILKQSWAQFHNTINPAGMYYGSTIYVNRDTDYPDDQHFGMAYIHELMHHQGWHHSKQMTTEEMRLHRIFYGLAKEQSLL
jgi:hypothetical protein